MTVVVIQVADFGLSRIKHATFLTTKSGRGTVSTVGLFVVQLKNLLLSWEAWIVKFLCFCYIAAPVDGT